MRQDVLAQRCVQTPALRAAEQPAAMQGDAQAGDFTGHLQQRGGAIAPAAQRVVPVVDHGHCISPLEHLGAQFQAGFARQAGVAALHGGDQRGGVRRLAQLLLQCLEVAASEAQGRQGVRHVAQVVTGHDHRRLQRLDPVEHRQPVAARLHGLGIGGPHMLAGVHQQAADHGLERRNPQGSALGVETDHLQLLA